MVIKQIRVQNFKSIKDSGEIRITKLFGLVGRNNSGKSALLDAVRTFFGQRDLNETDFHKNNGAKVEISIVLATDYETPDEVSYKGTWSPDDQKPIFPNAEGEVLKPAALKKELPHLLVVPAIRNPANETTAGSKSYLKELIAAILGGGAEGDGTEPDEKTTPAAKYSRSQLLRILQKRTKGELKSLSEKLSGNFQEAVDDKSISVEIDAEGDLAKALAYSTSFLDPNLGEDLSNVDILSCGTGLQSMAILALLQTYAQGEETNDIILLVEEPEIYLHPELQRKMFKALRQIARRNQVLFTTHSPIMVSELWADDSLRLVKRSNGISTFQKISIPEIVDELGIRYEDVLNPKFVVFVEGPVDEEFYSAIAAKVLPGKNLETTLKFIVADGYRNIHAYALLSILASSNVKCNAHAIVDGDGIPPDVRKKELLAAIDKHLPTGGGASLAARLGIHVISQHEIESFLLDPAIIKVLLRIPEKDIKTSLEFYRQTYANAQKGVKTQAHSEAKLARHLRPSLIFESNPNPSFQKAYAASFSNNRDFLDFRQKLSSSWAEWKKKHPKPYGDLIMAAGFASVESLKEPIGLIREILK